MIAHRWDVTDLVASSDLAEVFGVTRSTVSNWIRRHPDFPPPIAIVARGAVRLYSYRQVHAWYERRRWQHAGPGSKNP